MKREILDAIRSARAAKQAAVLFTNLETHQQTFAQADDLPSIDAELADAAHAALRADRGGITDTSAGPVFIQVFNPPLRMIIVGAVHISQALAPMASLAGYAVTIVDPRRSFASAARFPDIEIRTEWPDEALADIVPDSRTAVVTLTHDPKLDDPALAAALRSPCFYIGSLGSTRTHAARLKRLTEAGFSAEDLERIYGPVGLSIGARSPAEIAVAILGQITRTLRNGDSS